MVIFNGSINTDIHSLIEARETNVYQEDHSDNDDGSFEKVKRMNLSKT